MKNFTPLKSSVIAASVFFLSLIPNQIQAQTLDAFLSYLGSLSGTSAKDIAVDSFWAQLPAVPWIDGDTAHFLYKGSATSMDVAGDFNGWNPSGSSLTQAFGTSLWYRSIVFESDARLDYKLVRNGSEWILDPANPNMVSGGFGPNSELAMPDYVQPWEIETRPGVPAGTVLTGSIASAETSKTYSLQIYLPPGYDESRPEGYPVAYFQDGHEYVGLASAATIFDNLIDSGLIEPVIGVFVRPTDRNNEYAGTIRYNYADFFGRELVPYIDATYHTVPNLLRRAVIGASFGGNISAIITMEYPDLFANCGLHSGAFWPNGYDTYNDWIALTPSTELRVAAAWGSYEGSLPGNMYDFIDVLEADATEHIWEERHEGHSWGLWRSTLDDMLILFFPPEGRPVGFAAAPVELPISVFPNPAFDQVWIQTNELASSKTWMLMDAQGRILQTGLIPAGNSNVAIPLHNLPAGMYLVQLQSEQASAQRLISVIR